MSTEWSITFKVRVNEGTQAPSDILRFTNNPGSSYGKHGDRIPLVGLFPNATTIDFSSSVNEQASHNYKHGLILFNQTYHIEIHQRYISNGNYRYYIVIDGDEMHSAINSQARQFHNVHVFASTPDLQEADAFIQNLEFTNFL